MPWWGLNCEVRTGIFRLVRLTLSPLIVVMEFVYFSSELSRQKGNGHNLNWNLISFQSNFLPPSFELFLFLISKMRHTLSLQLPTGSALKLIKSIQLFLLDCDKFNVVSPRVKLKFPPAFWREPLNLYYRPNQTKTDNRIDIQPHWGSRSALE